MTESTVVSAPQKGANTAVWSLRVSAEPDPVGVLDVARRCGVKRQTVSRWRSRQHLATPEPRWEVSDAPAWDWHLDWLPWLHRTGRAWMLDRETEVDADA